MEGDISCSLAQATVRSHTPLLSVSPPLDKEELEPLRPPMPPSLVQSLSL